MAYDGRRNAVSACPQTYAYAYDSGWNFDYRKVDGVTEPFSTNGTNELTSSPLGSASYDSNGNLTDDGNTEYTYDHANRLTQAEWQDGADYWRESYKYDGLQRLREIYRQHSTNGTTWNFSSDTHFEAVLRFASPEIGSAAG